MEHPQFLKDDFDEDLDDIINPFVQDLSEQYRKDEEPNYFNFKIQFKEKLGIETEVENDAYLGRSNPINFFGKSIKNVSNKFKDFKVRSGFRKKDFTYEDYVEKYQARSGKTTGGKGLTSYTKPFVFFTAGMSNITNINISIGCSNNCNFCRESNVSRNFTQMDVKEKSETVKIKMGKEVFEVSDKVKVKFWDCENKMLVYGPLEIALHKNFPVSVSSILKIGDGKLFRVLSD